jgi:hypothetical protein
MTVANQVPLAFLADWDNDGFVNRDARPGDGLNLMPTPLTWANIDVSADAGCTATKEAVETRYGQKVFRISVNTSLTVGGHFGRSSGGVVDDIPVTNGQTYWVGCWMRGVSGYAGVPFALFVKNVLSGTLFQSSNQVLTADWQLFGGTITISGGDNFLRYKPEKQNNATACVIEATGFMLVAGSTAPSGFNAGGASNLYDNLTNHLKSARWALGMRRPYQHMADENEGEFVLYNPSKVFSPEYASSPLFGEMVPQRTIRVEGTASPVADTNLWVGWIDVIAPTMGGTRGPFLTRISCVGAKQFLDADELNLALQTNKRADQVIETILAATTLPPSVAASDYDLDTGESTFEWVGDNFDKFTTAYDAILALMVGERGKFFFNRSGQAAFFNRQRFQLDTTVDATFTDVMVSMDYSYGDLIVNECRVKYYRRSVSATATETLWTLDDDITLLGGESLEMRARFAAAGDARVGGTDLVTPSTGAGTLDSTGANVTITGWTPEAQSVLFTLNNASATKDCVVTICTIKGRKVTTWNGQEIKRIWQPSIDDYGRRVMIIDAKLIDGPEFAKNVGANEVKNRKDPRGMATGMTLLNKDTTNLNQQLQRTIGDRIAVEETQTAHDQEYFIVGERHTWTLKGTVLETSYALEPALIFDGWLLGTAGRSELGETTYLGL